MAIGSAKLPEVLLFKTRVKRLESFTLKKRCMRCVKLLVNMEEWAVIDYHFQIIFIVSSTTRIKGYQRLYQPNSLAQLPGEAVGVPYP